MIKEAKKQKRKSKTYNMAKKMLNKKVLLLLIFVSMLIVMLGSVRAAGGCECYNCLSCNDKLNDASCTEVKLTRDILNYGATCINNPSGFNNKIFDCQGYKISGRGGGCGIKLISKQNNIIKNCVITNFSYGILLYNSSNNNLTNNIANSNKYGIFLSYSSNNNLTNNIANSNEYGIPLSRSSNNNLTNNIVNSNNHGIYLYSSSNNTLTNNNVNNNSYGVYLNSSSNNNLTNNIASLNNYHGISLWSFSNNNALINNIANNNNLSGIRLSHSSNNILTNNTASSNNHGIYLRSSSKNNTLINNIANSNKYYGIRLSHSSNNTLTKNKMCDNQEYDIKLDSGSNNFGRNNICNKPDGWNDTNTIGCTFACGWGECNLTSVSINGSCGGDGCDIGENVTQNASFKGACNYISKLNFTYNILETGENFSLLQDCTLSGDCSIGCSCQNTVTLPICVNNSTAVLINVTALSSGNKIITYNSTISPPQGFWFVEECTKLINLDLLPDFRNVIAGEKIPLTVIATFAKAGNTFYRDVTLSQHTYYQSNDTSKIKVNKSSTGVTANAVSQGTAEVEAKYPFEFPGMLNDTSYFHIFPSVGCTISSASIRLECGEDQKCNVSEKVNMSVKVSFGCSIREGGNITMIAENISNPAQKCLVNITGSFNNCVRSECNATWVITETNVNWTNCGGKKVTIERVELWNKTDSEYKLIAANQTYVGSFEFWAPKPAIPKYITISPENWTIQVGDNVSYEVWAHYDDGSNINITNSSYTNYTSNDTSVAYAISKNVFYGNSSGVANITVVYPAGYENNKSNSSILTVSPSTGCKILDANMTFYCRGSRGVPICDNGDSIDLGVLVNETCKNIAEIRMRAHEPFDQLNSFFCSFDMNVGLEARDCSLVNNNNYFCHKNWTVKVPQGCEGKNVIVDGVMVYNYSGDFLDSKQGYIGNFSFVQSPSSLRAIIIEPSDGTVVNLSKSPLVNFTQASIGKITNWTWLYRNISYPESPWTVLNTTSNAREANITNYNVRYNDWKAGNYQINLTVKNDSLADDDVVKITLVDDHTPIANITKPHEGEIVYNKNVTFESNCYDPDGDDLNLTWYFVDDNTNITGPNKTVWKVWHIFGQAKSNPFTVFLNATDGQNSSTDRVSFKIAYCVHDSKYIFAGDCAGYDNLYCNESACDKNFGNCSLVSDCRTKCDNCPAIGQVCNLTTGKCDPAPSRDNCSKRGVQPPSQCFNPTPGCFINKTDSSWECAPCVINNVKQIRSCSDYKNSSSCINDTYACNIGSAGSGGLGTEDCDTVVGDYYVTNCHCSWNGTACHLNKTYMPRSGPQEPSQSYECIYDITYSDCGIEKGGCSINNRPGRWINLTVVSGGNECKNSTTCQPCGVAFERLPFFDTWHIIITSLLLALFYFFIERRKQIIEKRIK